MIELGHRIELQVCVERLLAHLFPNAPAVADRAGRHTVLAELVRENTMLHLALLDNEREAIRGAWDDCLTEQGTDLRLLHTLAVLYRERALANPAEDGLLVVATALWALLLGTEEFWTRHSERVTGARSELINTVAGELLGLHASIGRHALAEGRDAEAKPHLNCLLAAGSGADALSELLYSNGIIYLPDVDEVLMRQVSALASGLLDDWTSDVIRAATKAVEDPVAIAKLPSGVSKNWAGGVELLQPLLRIGAPLPQVLRTGLDWYVDWSFALAHNKDYDAIENLLKAAGPFADQLMPLTEQGQGHQPANQALSQYFLLHGYVATSIEESTKQYRVALEWDPYNAVAQRNLDKNSFIAEANKGSAALKNKQYDQALKRYDAALALASNPADQAEITNSIAGVHNAQGVNVIDRANTAIDAFGTAVTDVLAVVKFQLSFPPASLAKHSTNCPACRTPARGDRSEIIDAIIAEVRRTGEFKATSTLLFWQGFERLLCPNCRSRLALCKQANHIAARHFTDALRINPAHASARANLDMITKRMGP